MASSDDTTDAIIFEGANQSQLSALFKVDERILKEKMRGIDPVGKRNRAPIYDVAVVAARMGKLTSEQVDAAMRRLNHADLPKMLTKEYWNGLRARQAYELAEGDLWPTAKIVAEVGDMVKTLKMELDLLGDALERTTELSDRQRAILAGLLDGTKTNMVRRLKERFEDAEKPKTVYDVSDL